MDTAYVIRTSQGTPLYYAGLGVWRAHLDRALHFEFKTIAELYATAFLNLSPSAYEVQLLAVTPAEDQTRQIRQVLARAVQSPR